MRLLLKIKFTLLALILISFSFQSHGQGFDSTQIGKKYPFLFPILGKKAYAKGYKLPLPHGIMVSTLFNKQGLILDDMELAFTGEGEEPNFSTLQPIADLIIFGPSDGRINTLNFRFDTWLLPFFSIGGYYGRIWGEQTIRLTSPVVIESDTDIVGQYYGFNLLGVAPLGPINIAADYSWSWTTNERLDKPVLVKVSGLRLIYRIPSKNPERFVAIWGGAQFQKLDSKTSGQIGLGEALGLDGAALDELDSRLDNLNQGVSDAQQQVDNLEMAWTDYTSSPAWDDLGRVEQARQQATYDVVYGVANTIVTVGTGIADAGQGVHNFLTDLSTSTVHYKFNKRLEHEWNMLLGVNWQISPIWQIRSEYGFLKSKQQLMISLNYRFGL